MGKKISKNYLGIKKTPVDDNTIVYVSFDGTTTAEIGGIPTITSGTISSKFIPTPTGLGNALTTRGTEYRYPLLSKLVNTITVDFICNLKELIMESYNRPNRIGVMKLACTGLAQADWDYGYGIDIVSTKSLQIFKGSQTAYSLVSLTASQITDFAHFRYILTDTKVEVYLNGNLILSSTPVAETLTNFPNIYGVLIGRQFANNSSDKLVVSDVAVSNIDKGTYFPTLPKDFIAGKANIKPALNPQRSTYSDALSSQYTVGIAKADDTNRPKQQTVTQAVTGAWASGDTIKIKGLGGEISGGVIDSDTALARIIAFTNNTTSLTLDDVSKLTVNDTVSVVDRYGTVQYASNVTITAIDMTNKIITVNYTINVADIASNGGLIVESTASTSAPVVKFSNAGVLTTVAGTWTNLGTNEATFTLGTNASLTNQDIQIEYGLDMIAGQGATTEIYNTVLGGEVNAKKLVVGTVAVRDDFKGKISGGTVECPHVFKNNNTAGTFATLLVPSAFTNELSQNGYSLLKVLDGTLSSVAASISTSMGQQLCSFNLIRLVEDKFGPIPALDKVQWLKDNLNKITFNWYGYGTCPSGNKARLRCWESVSNAWVWTDTGTYYTTNGSVTMLSGTRIQPMTNAIDDNGFTHFLASTDASDGVTASTINTDYVYLDVELKTLTGYDILVPDNPRRDEGWHITSADMKKTDDFSNKIAGSNVDNPHKGSARTSNILGNPTIADFAEFSQPNYNTIAKQDYTVTNTNTSTNGYIAQHASSFNLIELIERKYGPIPAVNKVQWIKDNISKITCNAYVYGTCPAGNKATITYWSSKVSTWFTGLANTNSSPLLVTINMSTFTLTVGDIIDANGFTHLLVYADASDGVTASTIYTDYINCEVTLKESAFNQLPYFKSRIIKSNVLQIRKETKEVKSFFAATNDDNIAITGNYVPYKGLGDIITKAKILAVGDPIISTLGTGGSDNLVNYSGIIGMSSRLPSLIEDYKLTVEKFKNDGVNVDIDRLLLKPYTYYGDNSRRLYPVEGVYLQPNSTLTVTPIRGVNKRPFLSTDNVSSANGSMVLQFSLPQTIPSEAILLLPMLVTENNKIYMVILSTKKSSTLTTGTLTFYSTNITYDVFDINGRPIIK